MTGLRERLQNVRPESGYSLIELLVVVAIMAAILGGLSSVFLQGTHAESNLNDRFQGQTQAGVALDKLRREVRCASAINPTGSSSSITLTLPSICTSGGGQASWCAVGSGTRYGLYRASGATCNSSGVLIADYLVNPSVFNYTPPAASTSLGKLAVDLRINVNPATPDTEYELTDSLVLRNTNRT